MKERKKIQVAHKRKNQPKKEHLGPSIIGNLASNPISTRGKTQSGGFNRLTDRRRPSCHLPVGVTTRSAEVLIALIANLHVSLRIINDRSAKGACYLR